MGDGITESNAPIEAPSHRPPPRWPMMLALILVCLVGGSAGYFRTKPLYRSQGLLHLAPVKNVLRDQPPTPISSDDIDTQLRLVCSRRVIDLAMRGPDWAKSWATTPQAGEDALQRLSAKRAPGGMIQVSYLHPDPNLAEGQLKAIMLSYYNFAINRNQQEDNKRLNLLAERRSLLASQIVVLDGKMLDSANLFGASDLKPLHDQQIEQVVKLEAAIREAERAPGAATPTTAPALAVLAKQRDAQWAILKDISRQRLKIDDYQRQRDEAIREKEQLTQRINELQINGLMSGPLSIVSIADSATLAVDHRRRDAAWGALAALVAFSIFRVVWRMWRGRRRVVFARTAFPVITTYTPKPVIPIAEAAAVPAST